jgi:hypothetical protein
MRTINYQLEHIYRINLSCGYMDICFASMVTSCVYDMGLELRKRLLGQRLWYG